jgi:hypothetical protein
MISAAVVAGGLATGVLAWALASDLSTGSQPAVADSLAENPTLEQFVAEVINNTSPSQRAILADGEVTFEEREAAIAGYAGCLEAEGLTVVLKPAKGLRATRVQVSSAVADESAAANAARTGQESVERCRAEYTDDVSAAYELQQGEPSSDQVADLYQLIEECVAAGGVPGEEVPGTGVSVGYENAPASTIVVEGDQLGTFFQCGLEAEAQTGLKPPPVRISDEPDRIPEQ